MKKKKISIIIIALIIFIITISIQTKIFASNDEVNFKAVEYTEEYKEYLKLSEEEKSKILPPRMYEVPKTNTESTRLLRNAAYTLESRYSLKDIIPNSVIVRDQKTRDICWIFASLSSLETNIALNSKDKSKKYDFSERHMDYALSNIYATGFNRKQGTGAVIDSNKALTYLTNGTGAVEESEMPFEDNSNNIDISEIKNKKIASQVFDTIEFPSYEVTEDTTKIKREIKEHIKNYGAVDASIHGAQPYTEWYNDSTGAIYCDDEEKCKINHAISIIGWDDDYPITNFNKNHRPKNPGAWIIKNSWGINIGDNGFMYVSYEDINIYRNMSGIIKSSDNINYENIYQYDELGFDKMVSEEGPIYIGESFTKKTHSVEYLKQVGLYVPQAYICKVYVNPNGTSIEKDSLQEVALKSGETLGVGYHTLEFLKPVKITGDDFTVVIKIESPNEDFIKIALESTKKTENSIIEFNNCLKGSDRCFYANEYMFEKEYYKSFSNSYYFYETKIKAFTVSSIENETYTINFNYGEGTGTITSKEVENNKTYGELPKGRRTGYTLEGWYNTKGEKIENNTTVDLTTDITLKAEWTPNKYTITFKSDKKTITSQQVTYDKTYGNLPTPEKEGYVFKGWYNGENKVNPNDIVKITQNTTLTAKWEKESEDEKIYLNAPKYKIQKDDENEETYLNKIQPETTVAEVITNCETNGTINVIDKKGNILRKDDIVGTGMKIQVTKNNNENIIMTSVVMGDLDGNGKVTATDLSAVNQTVLKVVKIEGAVFKAADLDDNEKITATDLSTINQVILKILKLVYSI